MHNERFGLAGTGDCRVSERSDDGEAVSCPVEQDQHGTAAVLGRRAEDQRRVVRPVYPHAEGQCRDRAAGRAGRLALRVVSVRANCGPCAVAATSPSATGPTRLSAREYDPAVAQFISLDPDFDGTDTRQLNAWRPFSRAKSQARAGVANICNDECPDDVDAPHLCSSNTVMRFWHLPGLRCPRRLQRARRSPGHPLHGSRG
jgi:hypothetical protein